MRISPGQPAVDFKVRDIFGNRISLADFRGKNLLLSFYRYAACPFCNYRVHELKLNFRSLNRRGLEMIAFFQSPDESIRYYVGKQEAPFPIVGDPERKVYEAYGVEASWSGFFKGSLRFPDLISAAVRGFLPGRIEGDPSLLPADFLIDRDLTIREAYYGRDIGDHLSTHFIEKWLVEEKTKRPAFGAKTS
jgi:thioredoxin-dependent peroxiredoxin